MIGTFMATGAFNIVYIQVPELYPTSVRNTALGICSAFARVTSIAATVLPSVLGSNHTLLLISSCCCGAAICSWTQVPETVGRRLPDCLPGVARPMVRILDVPSTLDSSAGEMDQDKLLRVQRA